MFRGFRWQLIVFVVALLLFAAAALFRLSRQSAPAPQPEATPTATFAPTQTSAPAPATAMAVNAPTQASASVYREGLVGSVQRLNPLFAHLNPPDRDITSLIFEGLFALNEYGETVPRLASELIISSDGLDYVVRLRSDILWQDGLPFSADDVIYTMSLTSDPRYAEISPAGVFWQTVETQKLSQDLIRFRLAQPYSSFPNLLTIGILPEHALRGTTIEQLAAHPFNLTPIGTGAYQLAALDYEDGSGISGLRLGLSPTYRGRPEAQSGYLLRELHFQLYSDADAVMAAYLAGDVDGVSALAPLTELASLPQSQIYRQVDSTLAILIFNWNQAPFEERRVRQALSLSLDLPQLVETRFGAAAAYADSPYAPGSSLYQPQQFWSTYDPTRAGTLLNSSATDAESDEDDTDENDSTTEQSQPYTLIIEDNANLRGLAKEIAAQWQLLGLDFVIEPLDAAGFRNRLDTGRFDAAIVAQRIGAAPDLFRFWHPAQSNGGANFGAASDNELSELLENARGEIYAARRALLYQRIQEVFAEQAIAIPLYYPVYTFVVRDDFEGIQLGYMTSPADRFRGIQHWRPAIAAS